MSSQNVRGLGGSDSAAQLPEWKHGSLTAYPYSDAHGQYRVGHYHRGELESLVLSEDRDAADKCPDSVSVEELD